MKLFFPEKFFFVEGETSYGYCCADEIAALHLNAELIIRVGNSCITKTQNLPVFFLFEEEEFSGKCNEDILEDFSKSTKQLISDNIRLFVMLLYLFILFLYY